MILIMAQGEQRRLSKLGYPKQLIELAGETIIARTIRLVNEIVNAVEIHEHIAVIGHPVITEALRHQRHVITMTLGDPGKCIVDGLAATESIWSPIDCKTVLLGDVVYSRDAIAKIFADRHRLVFSGTSDLSESTGETFSMTWNADGEMKELLRTCPCRVRKKGELVGGHLRRLLWHAMRRRRARNDPRVSWARELYIPIDDWTDDIDTPDDLRFLPKLDARIRAEATSQLGT